MTDCLVIGARRARGVITSLHNWQRYNSEAKSRQIQRNGQSDNGDPSRWRWLNSFSSVYAINLTDGTASEAAGLHKCQQRCTPSHHAAGDNHCNHDDSWHGWCRFPGNMMIRSPVTFFCAEFFPFTPFIMSYHAQSPLLTRSFFPRLTMNLQFQTTPNEGLY
ncbi:hypothetical protein OG21DRAFT_751582 [Imleria badia]|nr:hypothetical protein OG21DRAFT_751582 [Imleria badia]